MIYSNDFLLITNSNGQFLRFFLGLFIPMLLIFSSVERRKFFLLRLLPPSLAMCVLVFFQPMIILGQNWFVGFLLDFLLSLAIIYFSFKVPLPSLFFYGTSAWCVQHIFSSLDSLGTQIGRMAHFSEEFFTEGVHIAREIALFSIIMVLFYICFLRNFKFQYNFLKKGRVRFFILSITSVSVVYALSTLSITHGGLFNVFVLSYDTLACILLVILSFFLNTINHVERQRIVLDEIQKINSKQQSFKRENYESIAIRYHDLSKQLALLELSDNSESKQKLIDEMRGELENFATFVDTQNKALDIVLSEKKMICLKNDIKLFYKVDAHVLDFMDEVDVYTIFSNLFDNAIESVKDEKKENKVIKLNIYKRGNLISIDCQNYTSKDVAFKDGLPLTSKGNKQFHGYGTLSIKRAAEKYHGNVIYQVEKSIFNAYIILQTTENKNQALLTSKL